MTNLEKLYCNMHELSDSWRDMPETKKAYKALYSALGRESYLKYEDEISAYAVSHEKQGFIQGFRYAVSLLMEGGAGCQ